MTIDDRSNASRSLDDVVRTERSWLVRRIALVVRDVDTAEDLAQESLARLARAWPIPEPTGVRRWLATVGVRLAIDERRRRRRWGFFSVREQDASWAMTTDPDLWRALGDLDARTRAALVLTVLDGFSQDEAAALLGVPRGTLSSWLSRARDRLRPILEERVP